MIEKFLAGHLVLVCIVLSIVGIIGLGLCMSLIARDMGRAVGTALCYPKSKES